MAIVVAGHLLGTAAMGASCPTIGLSSGVFGIGAVLVGAFTFGRCGGLGAALVQAV